MITAALYALGQVLGAAAFLAGVLILWGLGWALLVGGGLLVGALVVAEVLALKAPAAPSVGRDGSNGEGAA